MMIINNLEWNDSEMRDYAEQERYLHDPANQEGNGYDRCEHCHYTRHPCSVNDLATMVLVLLDWKANHSELAAEPLPDHVEDDHSG